MIAVKIFNNNSILSKNDKGEEIILVGGGIGFGIRKNDEIDERRIEKVFCLEKETNYKFQSIVKNTPLPYILAADQIITEIKKKSTKKISVTLTKIKKAKKYKIQISKSKKFKKNVVTKTTKKLKVTIKSKKLKNAKKVYVRAKAVVTLGDDSME